MIRLLEAKPKKTIYYPRPVPDASGHLTFFVPTDSTQPTNDERDHADLRSCCTDLQR